MVLYKFHSHGGYKYMGNLSVTENFGIFFSSTFAPMDYFKKLGDLLKMEREEDRSSYQQLTSTSSVPDRRANGLTWYPIAIRGSEMSRGD